MSILLVDNEVYQIEALKRYLLSQGYQVLEAVDGKEAVRQFERHPQEIELIITDYLMPELDGLGLLKEVRRRDPLLPVIFMTAYADKEVLIQALRHSCDGFLEKPFTPEQLLREIRRIEEKAGQRLGERLHHQRELIADYLELGGGDEKFPQKIPVTPDQLLEIQKMELVGSMAGSIAHDFNNLLQTIQGYIDLLLLGKDQKQPEYEGLRKVEGAAESAADLVKQLLALYRHGATEFQPINLNQAIQLMKLILKTTIRGKIKIKMDLAEDLKLINAVPAQIKQLLINLVFNARDAMPEGGEITLATQNVTLSEGTVHGVDIKPGEYVQLTVTDTGRGMTEEMLDQIFQPFFTTKSLGQGSGLGLFLVKVIVNRHQGLLSCASAPGQGTTFTIDIPVWEERVSLLRGPKKESESPEARGGTVLLVEDDEGVRRLGQQNLTRLGYSVLAARSGEEALEIFPRHQTDIDVVLLDLIMPGMGGKECLAELLKIDPRANIIITSGCDHGAVNECVVAGARGNLRKPYKMEELLQAVLQVMDQESNRQAS